MPTNSLQRSPLRSLEKKLHLELATCVAHSDMENGDPRMSQLHRETDPRSRVLHAAPIGGTSAT